METVSTETENDTIDEIGNTSVIVFEGSDAYARGEGVLCSIYRVKTDI